MLSNKIMKENNKETTCEQSSSLTTVSTTYARICVILLALNFCITGYVLTGMLKLQQVSQEPQTTTTQSTAASSASSTPTLSRESESSETSREIKTLDEE